MFLKTYAAVIASGAKQSLPLPINYPEIASSPEPVLSPVEGAPRHDTVRPVCRHVLTSNLLFAVPRRVWRISMAVLACLMASASLAHAHGGMAGPEELGPPIFTSGLLGFVCYWLVILWPSSKKKGDTEVRPGTQNQSATRTRRRSHKNAVHVKRVPRLRKIERSGQVRSNVNSGRRATDV
jgi:hypothetical protein